MRTVTTDEIVALIAEEMKRNLPDKPGAPLPDKCYDLSYYAPAVGFLVSDKWDAAYLDDSGDEPVFVTILGEQVSRVPVPEDILDKAYDKATTGA